MKTQTTLTDRFVDTPTPAGSPRRSDRAHAVVWVGVDPTTLTGDWLSAGEVTDDPTGHGFVGDWITAEDDPNPAMAVYDVDDIPKASRLVTERAEALRRTAADTAVADLNAAAAAHSAASDVYYRTRDALRQAIMDAVAAGVTEAEAARRADVTRMTVRSWVGK